MLESNAPLTFGDPGVILKPQSSVWQTEKEDYKMTVCEVIVI